MSRGDGFDVRSLSVTYRNGHIINAHRHPWAQLVYARSGVMHVTADNELWLVPPTRAIWVPPEQSHAIAMKGETALRTLYMREDRAGAVNGRTGALEVGPLLGELIVHIVSVGMLDPRRPDHDRLAGVLMDLVAAAPRMDLLLPLPTDPRARKLADRLRNDPGDKRPLADLAAEAGASLRTLQRCFAGETGLTIELWRQKARLAHSAAALAGGASVTDAALDCGYDSASAYIAAFRRQFGATPGQFRRG
jgi:AraC-like DNA-binding protein